MSLFDHFRLQGRTCTDSSNGEESISPTEAQRKLEEGMALELKGQLQSALQCYAIAIHLMPALARAHFCQGNILLDLGDAANAVQSYVRAIELKPDSAGAHFNLGSAYVNLGCIEDSLSAFVTAIALKPEFVEAHMSLGLNLGKLGRHEGAMACFVRVVELSPDSANAHFQLGIALHDMGAFSSAIASYKRAIEIDFEIAELHNNLGSALKEVEDLDGAIASYCLAIEIDPSLTAAHFCLGVTLEAQGQYARAASAYKRTLEIESDHFDACIHLGIVLQELDQNKSALAILQRATELRPNDGSAHLVLGQAQLRVGRLKHALESLELALKIQPANVDIFLSLAHVFKQLGDIDKGLACIRNALTAHPGNVVAHSNLLFFQNYLADQPAERLLAEAQHFGETVTRIAKPFTQWPNVPDPRRTLRVGFVSGDLSGHPVGYFLQGVLAALASQATGKLELYAYPSIFSEDDTSKRLRACCKAWYSAVGLADAAFTQRIRDDGIDILIDLSGHTANNRLPMFAWKPAPIQVSWLGYFATTGVAAMDYFVADSWTLPPDQEIFFTEKIWRLPETRLCFTPPDAKVDVNALPALTNGYITFGCFNNLSKMNDAVVQLWARVLNAVPASRLFLKYQQLAEACVRQSTRERFAVHGIAADRLIFEDYVPRVNYLAAYHRVDIALDPFPFPGGTTTVEAMWMGIPVLTLSGKRFLARQGVGLLMNAGLPDWIASDHDDYVARAVSHASDLTELAVLRTRLRQQVLASPIYDASRFAGHFEAALRSMWLNWCATASAKAMVNK